MNMKRLLLFWTIIMLLELQPNALAEAPGHEAPYDGVWFLGFNLHASIWKGEKGLLLRKALAASLPRVRIGEIAGASTIPDSFIPPGLSGYQNQPWPEQNFRQAKAFLQEAGLSIVDPKIKNITLLHTAGPQTVMMAKAIAKSIRHAGFGVKLQSVKGDATEAWENALRSDEHVLFLMGYKAEREEPDSPWDAEKIIRPLFHSKGFANFTKLRDEKLDDLLSALQNDSSRVSPARIATLAHINQLLFDLLPAVPLFYIPTL